VGILEAIEYCFRLVLWLCLRHVETGETLD
jgi:hypothetical protein